MAKKQASTAQQVHKPLDAPNASQRAPVTDRVNVEPSILNGMTMSEAQWIAIVSGAVFLVVGLLIFAMTGFWQAILMLAIFGPAVTLWLASNQLLRIKRGRPDGYYAQAIHIWVVRTGLAQSKFITHHGYWELGRSLDLSFTTKFDMSSVPDDVSTASTVPAVTQSEAPTSDADVASLDDATTKEPKVANGSKGPWTILNAPPATPPVAKPHFSEPHMVNA